LTGGWLTVGSNCSVREDRTLVSVTIKVVTTSLIGGLYLDSIELKKSTGMADDTDSDWYSNSLQDIVLKAGVVGANELANNSITTVKLVDYIINSVKLASSAVETAKLADNAVIGDKIAADTIIANHISSGAIEAASIKAGAIGTVALAALAVTADKIAANTITADKYNQLRNVLPYNFDDSLDSSYPLECEFFMPPNTDEIKSAWVHIVGRNFRAYSKGAASGGGQTSGAGGGQTTSDGGGQTSSAGSAHKHTVSGGTGDAVGNHTHSLSLTNETTGPESVKHHHTAGNQSASHEHTSTLDTGKDTGTTALAPYGGFASHKHDYSRRSYTSNSQNTSHAHTIGDNSAGHWHSYVKPLDTSVGGGGHSHTLSGITSVNESSHTHTVSNHTHTVSDHTHTVSNHTHTLTFGIYESTNLDGVDIYCDDGAGYGASLASDSAPVSIDVNIVSSLTTTSGWKKIRITSTNLGRVVVALLLDITLSSV